MGMVPGRGERELCESRMAARADISTASVSER